MQPVQRKTRKPVRHGRLILLLALAALLAGSIGMWVAFSRQAEPVQQAPAVHAGTLHNVDERDVAALRITLRDGESWLMTQDEAGELIVDGDSTYQVAARMRDSLLLAASAITYDDVLTDDVQAYRHAFADFGLEPPRVTAEVTYRDGTALTMRIGDRYALDDAGWSYMIIDGDPRLYALDNGTADALAVRKEELHPVIQPVLHKARFDRIMLTDEHGQVKAEWMLQGDIGGDAADRWIMTQPVTYPADGASMSNLQDNLENIRMGAYVGEATEENLVKYGFDRPRFRLEIHMAEGSMGTTNALGEYEVTQWPESSFQLTIGAAKSDMVDYAMLDGSIYLTSHFSVATFMELEPATTLTHYVVPVALGNLQCLTIESGSGKDVYELKRTERVAENNELVYDEEGHVVYDVACIRNGSETAYGSFAAAYNELLVATVSGMLPEGWSGAEEPHTVYTFVQTDGTVHTVALVTYDAFHDAVVLDGHAMFYLVRDGLHLELE